MKNTPFLVGTVAAAMLHAPHCAAQSNVVFYGTNASSILVSFVDTNLSASAKASIVTACATGHCNELKSLLECTP